MPMEGSAAGSRLGAFAAAVTLVAVCLLLDVTALDWGQPGGVEWDADSIAGVETTSQLNYLAGPWRHRYPRLQFLLNAVFYEPLAQRWASSPVWVLEDGKPHQSRYTPERLSLLILIARALTAAMGTGTVVAVFLTARALFEDLLAAFLAGLALALTQTFVLYSHMGNVDVPAAFWFAWGMLFAVKAAETQGLRHYLLAGVMCALAGSTKEPLGGYAAGLGVALLLAARRGARPIPKGRALAGALATLVVFASLNDVITYPAAFLARMSYWIGGPGVTGFNTSYAGQIPLLRYALECLYLSMGWPLLLATAGGLFWCARRNRAALLFALLPLAVFYIAVVVNVRMVMPRFFIPGFAGLALIAGKGCAGFLRCQAGPRAWRTALVGAAFGLSALYCIGIDLEMLTDSRYEAESWFVRNVQPPATVATLASPAYAPRLQLFGFDHECRWDHPIRREILSREPADPEYLVLNERSGEKAALFDPAFHKELLDGTQGYRTVAFFTNAYLWPARSVYGVAGWGARRLEQVSPRLRILHRETPHD